MVTVENSPPSRGGVRIYRSRRTNTNLASIYMVPMSENLQKIYDDLRVQQGCQQE